MNEYVWNLYLKSGGQAVVDMFRRNLTEKLKYCVHKYDRCQSVMHKAIRKPLMI